MQVSFRGALTSKPYSFIARPWEFKTIESVDFLDSTGSSIRFDVRGDKILRALPRINESINDDWISDRIRFSIDGLRSQRVDRPLFRNIESNIFIDLSWSKLIYSLFYSLFYLPAYNRDGDFVSSNLNGNCSKSLLIKLGTICDLESLSWLVFFKNSFLFLKKNFGEILRSPNFISRHSFYVPFLVKNLFTIKSLLLVSINPRFESPVLNIRLRQSSLKFGNCISSFGQNFFSNFSLFCSGGISSFFSFLRGNHWLCSSFTGRTGRNSTLVLLGYSFDKFDPCIFQSFYQFFNVKKFYKYSSYLNAAECGLSATITESAPVSSSLTKFNLHIGGLSHKLNKKDLNVAAVHHGTPDLLNFDIILPVSAPFEKNSTFLNFEGLPQLSRFTVSSPNNVLDFNDFLILIYSLGIKSLCDNSNKSVRFSLLLSSYLNSYYLEQRLSRDKFWFVIYKILDSFNLTWSQFIKEFFSPLIIPEFGIKFDSNFEKTDHTARFSSSAGFANRNSGEIFESVSDFYLQDEIAASSFSLIAASDRLSVRKTYIN